MSATERLAVDRCQLGCSALVHVDLSEPEKVGMFAQGEDICEDDPNSNRGIILSVTRQKGTKINDQGVKCAILELTCPAAETCPFHK